MPVSVQRWVHPPHYHDDRDRYQTVALPCGRVPQCWPTSPADPRQQLADLQVSPDGKTVAFIAGIMSDFGSTGGDIHAVDLDKGGSVDVTPGLTASATSFGWSCRGTLRAELLAGDQRRRKSALAGSATGAISRM
jgi:hypothetical protein